MRLKSILILIAAVCLFAACNDNNRPVVQLAAPVPTKPAIEEPFKFHKLLEVSPGNYYDVFSWGRGTKDGGQYIIMRSDSSDQQYNSVSGDLEGPIKDVMNADMDTDGNPEIIIYARSIDTNRYVNVFAYEYQNDNARKLDFPRLTESQRKGYRGGDNFYIKDSKLIREFPVYNGKGKEATPSGQKRILQYSLQSNTLYAKQISTDSTSLNRTAPAGTTVPAKTENKPKEKVTTKKRHVETKANKKHIVATKRHHKKHR